jgi:hypothetical protein
MPYDDGQSGTRNGGNGTGGRSSGTGQRGPTGNTARSGSGSAPRSTSGGSALSSLASAMRSGGASMTRGFNSTSSGSGGASGTGQRGPTGNTSSFGSGSGGRTGGLANAAASAGASMARGASGRSSASSSAFGGAAGQIAGNGSYYGPKGGAFGGLAPNARYAAANMQGYTGPNVQRSPGDAEEMGRMMTAESGVIRNPMGGINTTGLQGVGDVIRNRMASARYGGTVNDVITQPGQFSPIGDGSFARTPADYSATRVAESILNGESPPVAGNALNYGNLNTINNKPGYSSSRSKNAFNGMSPEMTVADARNPNSFSHTFGTIGEPSDVSFNGGRVAPSQVASAAPSQMASPVQSPMAQRVDDSMVAGKWGVGDVAARAPSPASASPPLDDAAPSMWEGIKNAGFQAANYVKDKAGEVQGKIDSVGGLANAASLAKIANAFGDIKGWDFHNIAQDRGHNDPLVAPEDERDRRRRLAAAPPTPPAPQTMDEAYKWYFPQYYSQWAFTPPKLPWETT